jgi:hypothetical protein
MDLQAAINSFISLAALGILFFLWWKAYPSMRVEEFRLNIFALRNSIFDKAAKGEISFDDPMYQIVRAILNGMLKDADNLTFLDFLGRIYRAKKSSAHSQFSAYVEHQVSAMPAEKKAIYQDVLKQIGPLLSELIIKRSLILYCVDVLTGATRFLRKRKQDIRARIDDSTEVAEYQAYQIGSGNLVLC